MDDEQRSPMMGLMAIGLVITLVTVLIVVLFAGTDEPICGPMPSTEGGDLSVSSEGTAPPTAPGTTTVSSAFRGPGRPDHQGTDYAGPTGTPIYAYADGRVVAAGPAQGFGNWIVVDHNFDGNVVSSVYGHMYDDGVLVSAGEQVRAGQQIGKIGSYGQSTGPHLHFEIWNGGRLSGGSPVDPAPLVEKAEQGGGDVAAAPAPQAPAPTAEATAGLNPRQAALAKLTVAIGERMGVPEQGIVVALATVSRESGFRMYANDGTHQGPMPATPAELIESLKFPHDAVGNDHASVNQFQQQVNYWGTVPELMDPVTANRKFYEALKKVPGWESMAVTVAAQTVQGSALPDAYAEHEPLARSLYTQFKGSGDQMSEEDLRKLGTDGTATAIGTSENCVDTGTGAVTGSVQLDPNSPFGQNVIAAASKWIGTRYSWGGGDFNGPTNGIRDGGVADSYGDYANPGFDCSGLVRYAVFHASGGEIQMTRTTYTQVNEGQPVPLDQMRPGDLIFFGSPPHHVGIYYGQQNGEDMLLNAPQSGATVSIMPLSNWSETKTVRRMG